MSSAFHTSLDESGDHLNIDSSVAESADSNAEESVEASYKDRGTSDPLENVSYSKSFQKTGGEPGKPGPPARLGAPTAHLPNLEPHQHSTLFYLSLIEGRCRTQAAHLMNQGRHPDDQLSEDHPDVHSLARHLFAEMSKELHKAGILPDEFAGRDLEDIRGQYLTTFDSVLHNIASKVTNKISDHSTASSIENSGIFATPGRPSLSAMEQLVKFPKLPGSHTFLSSLILKGTGGQQLPTSIFQTQYGPKSLLGKGGFGHVFKVKNLVDDREYAVKRIVIRGNKVNLAGNKEQQQALLMEARSLSKLNHLNIVRYYGAWLETCPAGTRLDGDTSSAEISESGSYGFSDNFVGQISKLGELTFDEESKLEKTYLPKDLTEGESDVFERASPRAASVEPSYSSTQSNRTTELSNILIKRSKASLFQGADSKSEENKIVRQADISREALVGKLDAIVFIKMDLYPMTLEDFLWAGQADEPKDTEIQHCFHTLNSARILGAILDGVDYIHSQGMVHRDLKPGNILLSVHHGPNHSPSGSIELHSCPECGDGLKGKQTFITPHIGDFGLVAEIKKSQVDLSSTSALKHKFEPTELARLAPAGSKLYLPQVPTSVICPKLDVYSLGIVAFELLYKFGTKTERIMVLEKMKHGEMPADFKTHEMAAGVKGMTCKDRNERWDCGKVREWLETTRARHGGV